MSIYVHHTARQHRARQAYRVQDQVIHPVNARASLGRVQHVAIGPGAPRLVSGSDRGRTPFVLLDETPGRLRTESVWLDRPSGILEVTCLLLSTWRTRAPLDDAGFQDATAFAEVSLALKLDALEDGDADWSGATSYINETRAVQLAVYPGDTSGRSPRLDSFWGMASGFPGTLAPGFRDGLLYPEDLGLVQRVTLQAPYSGAPVDTPLRLRVESTLVGTIDAVRQTAIPGGSAAVIVVGCTAIARPDPDSLAGPGVLEVQAGRSVDAEDVSTWVSAHDTAYARQGCHLGGVIYDDLTNGFAVSSTSYTQARAIAGDGLEVWNGLWRSDRVQSSGATKVQVEVMAYLRQDGDVRQTYVGSSTLTRELTHAGSTGAWVRGVTDLVLGDEVRAYLEAKKTLGGTDLSIYHVAARARVLPDSEIP